MQDIQEKDMGLLDIINGIQNGPRGQSHPSSSTSTSSSGNAGGMSPIMMALLGLLAYKTVKGKGGQAATPGAPKPPGGTVSAGSPSGGIGDILGGLLGGKPGGTLTTNASPGAKPSGSLKDLIPGGLGGLLGGGAVGTVLSGGLGNLIKEFQDKGHGQVSQSWIGTGSNQKIASNDLASVIGNDTLDALSQQTGLGREELLAGLSQHLPDLIDQLTPNGRLPTEQEALQMI
jgi:uncharacterized protein YidB (DUF937 family)